MWLGYWKKLLTDSIWLTGLFGLLIRFVSEKCEEDRIYLDCWSDLVGVMCWKWEGSKCEDDYILPWLILMSVDKLWHIPYSTLRMPVD